MNMKTALDCIPCLIRQATEAIAMSAGDTVSQADLLRTVLRELATADWETLPVCLAQRIHRQIRTATGQSDPYQMLKGVMNRIALDLLPAYADVIRRQPNERDSVVRMAIAGNLLDSGAKTRLAPEALAQRLEEIWETPLIGDVDEFFKAAEAAQRILYLADNAGEIVFDRLLIDALPTEKITVAVRGSPVLNDATLADAKVAGLPERVPVISNGSDAPGTLIDDCSVAFRHCFQMSDMNIAKGQGNYECLCDNHKPIWFLLTVKCPRIAAHIGDPEGSLIVKTQKRKGC